MKKNLMILGAAAMILASCGGNGEEAVKAGEAQEAAEAKAEAVTYSLDAANSNVTWYAAHVGKDLEGDHYGNISVTEGNLVFEGEALTAGSFTADMNSITAEDLKEDAETLGKFLGHIQADDFFDVANHPTASFEITGVEAAADTLGNTHLVSGNLTLKGTAKNITFPAKVEANDNGASLNGTVIVNQKDWGILEALIDKGMIQDKFKFVVDLKTKA